MTLEQQLASALKACNAALDKLAGGPHYRDEVYEALELAKDALDVVHADELARRAHPCGYCNGSGDASKG